MLRRNLLATIPAAFALAGAAHDAAAQSSAPSGGAQPSNAPVPFDGNAVRGMARDLAAKPFRAPDSDLPRELADLTYDKYRDIRFNPQRAWWRDAGLPFQMQLFHRGFLYKQRVEMYEVAEGKAQRILSARTCSASRTWSRRSPPIWASPASACMRRSTGRTISTRSAPSSAPPISAPWPRT